MKEDRLVRAEARDGKAVVLRVDTGEIMFSLSAEMEWGAMVTGQRNARESPGFSHGEG